MASALPRQPQYDVGVPLARAAQSPEAVDHIRLEPDQPLALLVDLVLIAHGPERQSFGYRVERGVRDRDADHGQNVRPARLLERFGADARDRDLGLELVAERGIEPHVNLIDKSERTDGTFSCSDFTFDTERDLYVCPGGKELRKYRRAFSTPRESVAKDGAIRYRAAQHDCDACMLKPKCCPNRLARKIARSVHEAARDKVRAISKTGAYAVSCRERKKVEMLFAHLKRILRLGRLRLRGPNGAKDVFLLAATAQNLRKLAKLIPLPAPIFAT